MRASFSIFVLVCIASLGAAAQQRARVAASSLTADNPRLPRYYYAGQNTAPRAVEFPEGTVTTSDFIRNINSYLGIAGELTFDEIESNPDALGMRHRLLQQSFRGIPLEGMAYRVHERNGFIVSANGKAMRTMKVDTNVTIKQSQAFGIARHHLKAEDTVLRNVRMLIVSKDFTFAPESFSLAFRFDIAVSLLEQWRISVDAKTGVILNKVSLVQSCFSDNRHNAHEIVESAVIAEAPPPPPYTTGSGLTNYYGRQNIRVEQTGSSTRMLGQTENGGIITTYDFDNVSILSLAIFYEYSKGYHFYSLDGTFDEPRHRAAVSVQWATEQAYEYYFKNHNRNSFDNNGAPINSYVHVDRNLDNAYWLRYPKVLAFGDGSNNNPLVELDVVGHELTHGLTQHENDLYFAYEPGALNESFSDILGKAIEFNVFGDTATWKLAKRFRPGGLRDMENPNLKGHPDTYLGNYWFTGDEDAGGVHYNSGVQNFWFYLLCKGGSGVNDLGMEYSVDAIGISDAAKITYRNLTEYIIESSDYFDSRVGSLLATADLYGRNSATYEQVANAWDAVGVLDEPMISDLKLYDITATTVKVSASLIPRSDNVSYHFEYGLTPALGNSTSTYDYVDKVEGIITGLQAQSRYYMRLVATNENGSSYAAAEFTTITLAPLAKIKQTVDVTETTAVLYGEVNPNSLATTFCFEYGLTPALGSVTPYYPLPDTTEFLNVSVPLTDLNPRSTYYFRLKAVNASATVSTEMASLFTAVKPIITAHTPLTAGVGNEIIITGENFNATPEDNLVTFGPVRAQVLSAGPTELRVNVPVGAAFGRITLLDKESGLATQSPREFVPTFSGTFTKNNLQLRSAVNDISVQQIRVEDMDGDNKPDIIASIYQGITIFQNVSQGGAISDESFVRNTYPIPDANSGELHLTDLDGNGLRDPIIRYLDGIRIYPNLSAPGYVFFGPPVDLQTGWLQDIVVADFDDDGHIDIAGITPQAHDRSLFTVFRNQNPAGLLSASNFEKRLQMELPFYAYYMNAGHLDSDRSLDLLVGAVDQDYMSVLINASQPGSISFVHQALTDTTRKRFVRYITHDFNQDGKDDIVSHAPVVSGDVVLWQHTGSTEGVELKAPGILLTGNTQADICAGDLNGDGKVDLIAGLDNRRFVYLMNTTEAGEDFSDLPFENFDEYGLVLTNNGSGTVDSQFVLSDLNGDGRPEVIATYDYSFYPRDGYEMEIWQNAESNCADPSLVTLDVDRNSATIILPPDASFDQYEIEFRNFVYSQWWTVNSPHLTYLNPGETYEIRIRSKCYLWYTNYHYIRFTTDCADVSSFYITSLQATSVTFYANDITQLEVQYSPAGQQTWITLPEYFNSIYGLTPGATYDLRYRGKCSVTNDFHYEQFTTLCPEMTSLQISSVEYNKALVYWSGTEATEALIEYSSDGETWVTAGDDGLMSPLIPGTQYSVRGRMICQDVPSQYISASFTTPCPRASELAIHEITPFSAHISWSDNSNTGEYTVKYSNVIDNKERTVNTASNWLSLEELKPGTRYEISVAPHCAGSEDFISMEFTTECYTPVKLSVSDVTQTTAVLSWEDEFGGLPFYIDYAIRESNTWNKVQTHSTTLQLTDLRPGTFYDVTVYIFCPSSGDHASTKFKTDLFDEAAYIPNPTPGLVVIRPTRNLIGNRFSLHDHAGKQLAIGTLQSYEVDLTGFAAGIYILKIEGEPPVKIVKL